MVHHWRLVLVSRPLFQGPGLQTPVSGSWSPDPFLRVLVPDPRLRVLVSRPLSQGLGGILTGSGLDTLSSLDKVSVSVGRFRLDYSTGLVATLVLGQSVVTHKEENAPA